MRHRSVTAPDGAPSSPNGAGCRGSRTAIRRYLCLSGVARTHPLGSGYSGDNERCPVEVGLERSALDPNYYYSVKEARIPLEHADGIHPAALRERAWDADF